MPFKISLLKIDRPTAKPTYNIHNPISLKIPNWLEHGLSHLNKHKLKGNLQDHFKPLLCSCSLKIESLFHFFMDLHQFTNIPAALLNNLQSIRINISCFSDNELVDLLLYGSS